MSGVTRGFRLVAVAVPALVVGAAGGLDPVGSAAASPEWWTLATAAPASPVAPGPGVLGERWTAPDGSPAAVAVALPRPPAGAPRIAVTPGDDDAATLEDAARRLRAAGGGVLALAPGIYRIAVTPARPGLTFAGLHDVTIAGTGARLVFEGWGNGIVLRNSSRIAVQGLSLGYARPAVLAATVRPGAAATMVELDPGTPAPPQGARAYQVSVLYGPHALYAGGPGRYLFYRAPLDLVPAGGRRYVLTGFTAPLPAGARVAIKLSAYLGAALAVDDAERAPPSNDLVLDHVAIRNGPGMGVFVARMGRGLAIVDSQFGEPGAPAATIAYDGLHVSGMAGDILVRNNAFTRTGDDAINLASPLFEAAPVQGDQLAVRLRGGGLAPGAAAALFDAALGYVGRGTVARPEGVAAAAPATPLRILGPGFRADQVRYVRDLGLLGNRYAIVGNRIGACECHAILAQGPNGLVRANRITDTGFNAIKIVTSAFWKEGAGAQNLIVEDNVITRTGQDLRRGLVAAAIMAYAEDAATPPGLLAVPVHARLIVRRNRIVGAAQGCVSVASAADVLLERNDCGAQAPAEALPMAADLLARVHDAPARAARLFGVPRIWVDPSTTRNVRAIGNVEE